MQRPRCSMKFPKSLGSTAPISRSTSILICAIGGQLRERPAPLSTSRSVLTRRGPRRYSARGLTPPRGGPMVTVDRREFLRAATGAAATAAALPTARRAWAQAKPTITYWNGLTGADGKVMDELIDQFTKDTGIRVEQQRIPWADLYAKLQVSVPAGQGPDIALIHTVEVPHFASDGVLEPIDESAATAKGFRGDDYLPTTWQGGLYQGKRYAIPLDVPQHILYLNVKVMRDAGLVGADGKPKTPGSRDELLIMAKQMTKGDTFGFSIGTLNPGKYTWGFQNLLWQNGANVYTPDLKRCALADPAAVEVADFWSIIQSQQKIALPANANCRDAFIAGKLGMWIAGSWNFTGLREAKVDFTVKIGRAH